jgi:serine/threonine-protein kinase
MGDVWTALDETGRTRVAVKLLRADLAADSRPSARFEREAALTRRVQSPYVCRLLDAGHAASGARFLVFELLRGEALSARLQRAGRVSLRDAWPIGHDVLAGLEAAHELGVVHRDVKPANIFVEALDGGGERFRILDFGVSKLIEPEVGSEAHAALSSAGTMLGSFPYVPPEQCLDAATVDASADVYATAAVLVRALAGRAPFEAPSPAATLALKVSCEPPSLSDLTGEVWPSSLEEFLRRALARDRAKRFPGARQALDAWMRVGRTVGGARARSPLVRERRRRGAHG